MGLSAQGLGARFWSLIGATFLGFLGIGTVLPRLAPHVRHDLGGSDQTVGFVIGIFSFVALAGRFVSGPLADRRGRKTALLVGVLSCAGSGTAYLMPFGIAGGYLARTLQGFGGGCLLTGDCGGFCQCAFPGGHGFSDSAPRAIRKRRTGGILRVRFIDSAFAILSGRFAGPYASGYHVLRRTGGHGGRLDRHRDGPRPDS